ncbi:hypothetical protein DS2_09262 [Catenovulum agarivorans DS-2]|uniref:Uncharacterized protein n=1 Tax=Catenovulum agarivorans DS-2 TaxID=1328313 RepID=W7QQF0_9ALTE|nr:XrtA/PEP-CTERM system TPR-repeat protein PrsT [Catenovulum agarivorans]EWH10123.1 hypothetical protein DS2_09262 [Catenovulum agarivorans DS-2]
MPNKQLKFLSQCIVASTFFSVNVHALTSSDYFESALQYKIKGQQEEAVIELKNSLQQDFNNIAARVLLGQIYLENGEVSAAEKEFKIALSLGADTSLILLDYGKALYQQGKTQLLLEEIVPSDTDPLFDAEIYILRGSAQSALNLFDKARIEFNLALQQVPDYLPAKLALIGLEMIDKKFDKAERELSNIVQQQPSAKAYYLLAEIARQKGLVQQAFNYYQQSIDLDSSNLDAIHGYIEYAMQTKANDQADNAIKQLEQKYPLDPLTKYYRGMWHLVTGDSKKAKEILSALADKLSSIPEEYLAQDYELNTIRAVAYYLLEQPEKVRATINPLLLQRPSNISLATMLAEIEYEAGNYYTAQNLLQKWRRDKTKYFKYYIVLAQTYAQLKLFNEAHDLLKLGLEVFPNNSKLEQLLASTYVYLNKIEDAKRIFKKYEDEIYSQFKLANILFQQRHYVQALEYSRKIIGKAKNDWAVHNFHGACLLANGQAEQAQQVFEEIIAKDADFIPAKINLIRLYLKEQKVQQAQNLLDSVLKISPAHEDAINIQTQIYKSYGQLNQAKTFLESRLEYVQVPNKVLKELVSVSLALTELSEAEKYISQLNDAQPLSPFVIEARVQLFIAQSNEHMAKQSARSMYALYLNDVPALFRIANYQLAIPDKEGLHSTVERLEKLEVDARNICQIKSRSIYLTSGIEPALSYLEQVRLQVPALIWLEAKKQLLIEENDLKQALEMVEHQLNIRTYERYVKERIGLLTQLGEYEKAINYTRAILNGQANAVEYQTTLTDLYLLNNQADLAIESLQASLALSENDPRLLNNLANLLVKNDPVQALAYIEKAYAIAPKNPQILDTYGWVLVNLDRADEGLKFLREAYTKAPRQADVHFHLAVALSKLNRISEAMASLKTAKSLRPSAKLVAQITQLESSLAQ